MNIINAFIPAKTNKLPTSLDLLPKISSLRGMRQVLTGCPLSRLRP